MEFAQCVQKMSLEFGREDSPACVWALEQRLTSIQIIRATGVLHNLAVLLEDPIDWILKQGLRMIWMENFRYFCLFNRLVSSMFSVVFPVHADVMTRMSC